MDNDGPERIIYSQGLSYFGQSLQMNSRPLITFWGKEKVMKARKTVFSCLAVIFIIGPLLFTPKAEALSTYTEMVPGHDGTLLATDVYLPGDGTGRWPVLLSRTPYNKGNQDDDFAIAMTSFGFAVVIQDLRGRYGSEGKDTIFMDDALDGVAAIDWIKKQSWYLPRMGSIGGIGTYGASALGITQNVLATQVPDDLVCILRSELDVLRKCDPLRRHCHAIRVDAYG